MEVEVEKGINIFNFDEAKDFPAGVYVWKVETPSLKETGVAVKQ